MPIDCDATNDNPYRSPAAEVLGVDAFREPRREVEIFLYVLLVITAAAVADAGWLLYSMVASFRLIANSGGQPLPGDLATQIAASMPAQLATLAAVGIQLFWLLATFAAWCAWIYRAAANVAALDPTRQHTSPAWAVGGHFVPGANLILPYSAVRAIYQASASADRTNDPSAAPRHAGVAIVRAWWGLVVLSGVAAWVCIASSDALRSVLLGIAFEVLLVAVAIDSVIIVRRINRGQWAQAKQMGLHLQQRSGSGSTGASASPSPSGRGPG